MTALFKLESRGDLEACHACDYATVQMFGPPDPRDAIVSHGRAVAGL